MAGLGSGLSGRGGLSGALPDVRGYTGNIPVELLCRLPVLVPEGGQS